MADYSPPFLFDETFYHSQSQSTELVIYSSSVLQTVTIAWYGPIDVSTLNH